jgi:hypothetical protein
VYGNIIPPASFNGFNIGLPLKLGHDGSDKRTRQSSPLNASVSIATACNPSPTTSPALGNVADRMLLIKFIAPPAAPIPAAAAAPAPAIDIFNSFIIVLFI